MYYGNIKTCDIADGLGVRVSLFVSGCRNKCPHCFQQQTWDFNYGELFTQDTLQSILDALKPSYIKGFSLLGGEPFEEENQRELVKILKAIKIQYPQKDIWCYSGYTYEDLLAGGKKHCEVSDEMLSYIDILVDGRFIEELKDITLKYRGSRNQRLIDLNKTRIANEVVLLDI